MTQGAAIRSQRNAARKVNVRQRPWGSLAIKRVPRGERPWRRVRLVLAQVSSMNTRRLGSSRPWYFFHWARRRAMSARCCSLAYRLFFKTDPFVLKEAPHCAVARRCAALGQFGHHCAQGQIRLLGEPRQQPLPLAFQQQWFAAALPLARQRCDHLTTLATLTPNSAAVARHVRPLATEPITRSRRSCE